MVFDGRKILLLDGLNPTLFVGRLRSQKLCIPLSSTKFRRYFPSGGIAACVALAELVTCVMLKFWKGTGAAR
jgi:hypothetical protein